MLRAILSINFHQIEMRWSQDTILAYYPKKIMKKII